MLVRICYGNDMWERRENIRQGLKEYNGKSPCARHTALFDASLNGSIPDITKHNYGGTRGNILVISSADGLVFPRYVRGGRGTWAHLLLIRI